MENKTEVLDVDEKIDKFEKRNTLEVVPLGEDPKWLADMKAKEQNSPANIMRLALTHGQDLQKIEKMLELQIKWEENEAKKAYFDAVAEFKKDPPALKKDKFNKQFKSYYVSLGNLLSTIAKPLGAVGLSVSFPTPQQTDKDMTASCKLSHRLGYSETMSMKAPVLAGAIGKVSGQSSRNAIQDIKTTFTYLRSATCEAVLGLAGTEASENDNDGNTLNGGDDFITKEQVTELTKDIDKSGVNPVVFIKSLQVESLSELISKDFQSVKNKLANIIKAKGKHKKQTRVPGQEG